MLPESFYQKALKAQERALKMACNEQFREQAMRAYYLAQDAIKRWDAQQIVQVKTK